MGRLEGEADTAYRARIQLAPEAFSVAGPASAYRFYALSAAPTIADASVAAPGLTISARWSWGAGRTRGRGELVAAMEAALDAMVWPGTVIISLLSSSGRWFGQRGGDRGGRDGRGRRRRRAPADRLAAVVSASIALQIDIDLTIYTGPTRPWCWPPRSRRSRPIAPGARKLGRSITRAGLFGAAMVSGVHNAVINQPPADVPITRQQVGACLGVAVRIAGHVD
jgi:phage-related baseplate assembly protein